MIPAVIVLILTLALKASGTIVPSFLGWFLFVFIITSMLFDVLINMPKILKHHRVASDFAKRYKKVMIISLALRIISIELVGRWFLGIWSWM